MPKASSQPLSALLAINKPTGVPSMTLLNNLQPLFQSSSLFKDQSKKDDAAQNGGGKGGKGGKGGRRRKWKEEKVKMGQGGTLDPLADGVLVIGTNAATKSLSRFLDCTKSYRAIGLLGSSTDSYDSEGKRVRDVGGWENITKEQVEGVLDRFRGEIEQVPPIYSALKMDGKPLYEYARTNTPLPRPIPSRKVTVSSLRLLRFSPGTEHEYDPPSEVLGEKERLEVERLEKMVREGGTVVPSEEEVQKLDGEKAETAPVEASTSAPPSSSSAARPPIFELTLTVSSGTYIRSIVHDIGAALGSAAHVVKLTRTRQGEFALDDHVEEPASLPSSTAPAPAATPSADGAAEEKKDGEAEVVKPAENLGCVDWALLDSAIKALEAAKKAGDDPRMEKERDAEGWLEWEREVLRRCKEV
ncbi:hypothetical protein JCM6882_004004 [Rhodosporidiobolus microsporus]